MRLVGVGDEPSDARSGIVASAGFPERHFVPAAIEAALARAVQNGSEHAFANFRKHGGDVQIALHTPSEILHFIGSPRILQIIKSAAISESGGRRNEVE